MLTGTVIGNVWASRRLGELPKGAFLEVETDGGQRLIAFDVLGSGTGERVLIAQGSVAAAWFTGKPPPIDALIIGSVDPSTPAQAAPLETLPETGPETPPETLPETGPQTARKAPSKKRRTTDGG